jgi:hypothetical protein
MTLIVVTVASGGLPVVDMSLTVTPAPHLGIRVKEAANGRGIAVTKVTQPKHGMAVTYVTTGP